ncbi:MAG: hypothetical protein KGL39_47625 [Patescibacteria group bacterium]|nr:hypothetical protein [Patescibacteria group bacterium]
MGRDAAPAESVPARAPRRRGIMKGVSTLHQQLSEVGRIRLGDERKDPRKPGAPLDNFRVTVAEHDRPILEDVVAVYGGEIHAWKDGDGSPAWQAILAAESIDVAIPPDDSALSIWYEQWKGGYCVVRCNGVRCQRPVGKGEAAHWEEGPCQCDPEGPACGLVTRLNVILLGVPAFGYFRLDTGSQHAARTFPAVVAMAQRMAQAGNPVPATLTIQAKTTKNLGRATPKQNFRIPVLRLAVGLSKDMLIAGPATTALLEGPKEEPAVPPPPETPAAAASRADDGPFAGLDVIDGEAKPADDGWPEHSNFPAKDEAAAAVPEWAHGTFGEADGKQRQALWQWRKDHGVTRMGAPALMEEFHLTPEQLNITPLADLLRVKA